MGTDCLMCHTSVGDNPFTYTSASDGFGGSPGFGCAGCHGRDYGGDHPQGVGLRAHHLAAGVLACLSCHTDDPAPLPENILPPYYGSFETNAFDSCNPLFPPDTWGESFSLDNDLGLDNDGDGLYDNVEDPDCGAAKPCPWDCQETPDGVVNTPDLIELLSQWSGDGSCNNTPGPVDITDLIAMLANWGACP